MKTVNLGLRCLAACAIAAVPSLPVHAGKEIHPVGNAAYRAECGSCHVAYPPALLNAQAWQTIMSRLAEHFGSDASLDAKTADEIGGYLAADASRKAGAAPPSKALPRITEARWFVREHDELPASLWKSEAVRSPANCAACHTRAEQGDYSERTLRLPK
jgi:hypothetical protein